MRFLIDTHAFLWFVLKDPQLSAKGQGLIADPNNVVEFSPASYWEIAIKISIGKYTLNEPFQDFMDREIAANKLNILHVQVKHVAAVASLPFQPNHKDPFDRLLIAQAMVEQIPLVSNEKIFDAYSITRLW